MIGTKLGPYEITAKLGEGGMGEVYRATDTRLKRAVAIKVLPQAFGWDQERRQRFEREAQILAQLHHPNIAGVYGLEDNGGVHALVMELVEGEDLSTMIDRGPLAFPEAVAIALQIAAALEAAHEHGVVHRDLKPANVKVTPDGVAKVLDFGLAKAVDPTSTSSAAMMHSPTLTARATQLGVVLGTAAYMAPEQAKGKTVDRRADIWAFGVVLFEMLTGARAFAGEDTSEVMASVLKSDPEWSLLPADTPAPVRRLLRRCLEKDPHKRLSAIGDARLELQDDELPAPAPAVVTSRPLTGVVRWGWVAAGLLAVALVASRLWPVQQATAGAVTRLSVSTPADAQPTPDSNAVAISPDGRTLAYVSGAVVGGNPQLWIRPLDSLVGHRVDNSDGVTLLFWAPDSQSVGFFSDRKLKRVSIATGRVQIIAEVNDIRGGTWNAQDVIVFAGEAGGALSSVSANGGKPAPLTTLDPAKNESSHRFPSFLPDGDHFLYATLPPRDGAFEIYVGSLHDASHRKLVGLLESAPVYIEPGWLLFLRHRSLAAQRFDLKSMQLVGEVITTLDEPYQLVDPTLNWTAGPATSISKVGSLAYFTSASTSAKLVILDPTGTVSREINIPKGPYIAVSASPDGHRAALVRARSESEAQIWVVDLDRGGITAVTSEQGCNGRVVWSPDSTRLVFGSQRAEGHMQIYMKDLADSGPERPFYQSSAQFKTPYGWSQDGKWIILGQLNPGTLQDIYLLSASNPTKPQPYYIGPGREEADAISPDGHWLLYTAENSGNWELEMQSFPGGGHPLHVASGGPKKAWWTADQRHVFYVDYTFRDLMTIDVEPGDPPRFGTPRVSARLPGGVVDLDALPDRHSWLALVTETGDSGSITVVQNWLANLGK